MKTATEILNKEIKIPCYLCGKGKITIRQRDIQLDTPHPLDFKTRAKLEIYLLKKIKEYFIKNLTNNYMKTLKNKAGKITEQIMLNFSNFNENRIIDLPKGKYNEIYERIYNILKNNLKNEDE